MVGPGRIRDGSRSRESTHWIFGCEKWSSMEFNEWWYSGAHSRKVSRFIDVTARITTWHVESSIHIDPFTIVLLFDVIPSYSCVSFLVVYYSHCLYTNYRCIMDYDGDHVDLAAGDPRQPTVLADHRGGRCSWS